MTHCWKSHATAQIIDLNAYAAFNNKNLENIFGEIIFIKRHNVKNTVFVTFVSSMCQVCLVVK